MIVVLSATCFCYGFVKVLNNGNQTNSIFEISLTFEKSRPSAMMQAGPRFVYFIWYVYGNSQILRRSHVSSISCKILKIALLSVCIIHKAFEIKFNCNCSWYLEEPCSDQSHTGQSGLTIV